jgi:hypothetical protein
VELSSSSSFVSRVSKIRFWPDVRLFLSLSDEYEEMKFYDDQQLVSVGASQSHLCGPRTRRVDFTTLGDVCAERGKK